MWFTVSHGTSMWPAAMWTTCFVWSNYSSMFTVNWTNRINRTSRITVWYNRSNWSHWIDRSNRLYGSNRPNRSNGSRTKSSYYQDWSN